MRKPEFRRPGGSLMIVLFQRLAGRDRDKYNMYWTEAAIGALTEPFDTLDGKRRTPKGYPWESSGRSAKCDTLAEAKKQVQRLAGIEKGPWRVVQVLSEDGHRVQYRVLWLENGNGRAKG